MDNFHDPKPTKAAAKKTVNSVLGRVARAGNSILSLLSGLLAASLILYSGFVLYDNFYTHTNAGNTWELAQYRPEVVVEDGLTPLSGGASLAVVNKDYRGWLTLYDTSIDYPLMQGEDDLYYAGHDIYGRTSITGAIYLAAGNTRGMSDSYNVIYGHHMDNGAMFGALDSYTGVGYAKEHKTGLAVSTSGVYDLTVFSVISTDAYERMIYSVGNRAGEVREFLRTALNGGSATTRVLYYDAAIADTAERIVALSTCAAANTNGRLVVLARMTRHDMLTVAATGYGDTYDAQAHGLRDITVNYPEGTTFEYSTDDGATWTKVMPTRTDVGTTVVLVRASHPVYGTAEATEVIRINPAPVTVTALDAAKHRGEEDPEFLAVVTGLVDEQEIDYTVSRPGAGTDEDEGDYPGSILPEGEQLQGNYTVTYVPGVMTISAPLVTLAGGADTELDIPDLVAPLAPYAARFQPRESRGVPAWALVNLICLIVTVYLFLPLLHLSAKFGRRGKMKSFNRGKLALREARELDDAQRHDRELIIRKALLARVRRGGSAEAADVTRDDFAEAVGTLYYHISKFTRRFRAGLAIELIISALAVITFLLTEDMRLPMVLIDRWTPFMIALMLLCWTADVWLVRYRDKIAAEEEEKELAAAMA